MMNRLSRPMLAIACLGAFAAAVIAAPEPRETDSGAFVVSYTPAIDPIEINTMHEWVLHIETPEGDPVESAEITIDGGMQAHGHGLPTAPRVTEYLGDGDYRARGFRFNMRGKWQVTLEIRAGETSDTITFDLML